MDNYKEALTLLTKLINNPTDVDNVRLYFDQLVSVIINKFPDPTNSQQEIEEVAAMMRLPLNELSDNILATPPVYNEVVFPIAIVRVIFNHPRIKITQIQLTKFNQFVKRYSKFF